MKSNMIATTIEQSKKLLELGLDPETADMHYLFENFITQPIIKIEVGYNKDEEEACLEDNFAPEYIPCWSLGALLELIPDSLDINEHFCLFSLTHYSAEYYDAETTEIIVANDKPSSPIEAAYNMVVWLLENGYIKKEPKTPSE